MLCTVWDVQLGGVGQFSANERPWLLQSNQSEHSNKEYITASVVKCCIDTSVR